MTKPQTLYEFIWFRNYIRIFGDWDFRVAFARYRFRFKGGIFLGLMLFRAVPGIALSLPVFMMWSRLGLVDTKMGRWGSCMA